MRSRDSDAGKVPGKGTFKNQLNRSSCQKGHLIGYGIQFKHLPALTTVSAKQVELYIAHWAVYGMETQMGPGSHKISVFVK